VDVLYDAEPTKTRPYGHVNELKQNLTEFKALCKQQQKTNRVWIILLAMIQHS